MPRPEAHTGKQRGPVCPAVQGSRRADWPSRPRASSCGPAVSGTFLPHQSQEFPWRSRQRRADYMNVWSDSTESQRRGQPGPVGVLTQRHSDPHFTGVGPRHRRSKQLAPGHADSLPQAQLLEEPPCPPLLRGCPALGASTWQNRPRGWKDKPSGSASGAPSGAGPEAGSAGLQNESASLNNWLFPGTTWFGPGRRRDPGRYGAGSMEL